MSSSSSRQFVTESSNNNPSSGFPHNPQNPAYKSLVFSDDEEAYSFYSEYAKSRGFSVSTAYRSKRSSKNEKTDTIHYIKFVCHIAGMKKQVVEGKQPAYERAIIKVGCEANIKLKLNMKKGGYVIYDWEDVHCHELVDLDKVHLMRSNRAITAAQKSLIDSQNSCGVPSRSIYDSLVAIYGGFDQMNLTRGDLNNYACTAKRTILEDGEVVVMQKWFRLQARKNSGFYYDIILDDNNEVLSVFWADSVMCADYVKFDDFFSFDTTYRTNKHSRPLGMFVGFNHHKKSCIFGGALLYNETIESFVWLFSTFLKCMKGKSLESVITDQVAAIVVAVREVFPSSYHVLCAWHIEQNAMRHLGGKFDSVFKDELSHLIKHVDSEAEFEFCWKEMLNRCFDGVISEKFSWLHYLYMFRKQWSSVWVKSHFTGGKTTNQLSEQMNAFTRYYLQPQLAITELLKRFSSMVDDIRFKEKHCDLYMQITVPHNSFKNSLLIRQAIEVFTPSIFKIIHREFEAGMCFIFEEVDTPYECSTKVIHVQRWDNKGKPNEELIDDEVVHLDCILEFVYCSCRFFESWGIICRHVLRVLKTYRAFGFAFCNAIPGMYVKGRWTRQFKKAPALDPEYTAPEDLPDSFANRLQRLCNMAVDVGTRISYNDVVYTDFMRKFIEAARTTDLAIANGTTIEVPNRDNCTSNIGDDEVFVARSFKERPKKDKSVERWKSGVEKRHLVWKQKRRKQMADQAAYDQYAVFLQS